MVLVAAVVLAGVARAAPLRPEDVPEPLQPWIEWALYGHEDVVCAGLLGDTEGRECAWPSALALDLDAHGGGFVQRWDLQRPGWVPLPGERRRWPQAVHIDDVPATVIERGGVPYVHLGRGRHTVTGDFAWDRLPEVLPIPPRTGLVTLRVDGEEVAFPDRDLEGRLWLQRREDAAEEGGRLALIVHRLVDDDIPLQLDTRIQLDVSGKGREVVLGPALPLGFVPMALDSPLPARIEHDRRLRVQVRAGRWQLRVLARREDPGAALATSEAPEPWPTSEVWVFRARPALRLVTVEDATAIDPQQTDLPPDWRQLPAYLMQAGTVMRLVERRRGDTDAPPDQLALARTLWLDFDGGGYTLHDRVTGTLTRSWRLDMSPAVELGRVAVAGRDQFITRLTTEAPPGVEIRSGALDLEADSRIDGATRVLPAVGWLHDFQSVSAQLQLPPGWRLLYASGVDQARPSWISDWTLLDLFVVLITALATARLFGWGWGAVALLAVGVSYTEPDAPQLIWLAVLAFEAVVRFVPAGTGRRALQLGRVAALAALAVILLPFLIAQMRQALYPALEYPEWRVELARAHPAGAPAAAPAPEAAGEEGYARDAMRQGSAPAKRSAMRERISEYAAVDPHSIVQTGPGLPEWSWHTVALVWSGPVARDQRLRLVLVPPALHLLLALLRVLLLAALVARLIGIRPDTFRRAAATVALLGLITAAPPARAAFPSDQLLDALRDRLLEPPECAPACAAIPRLRLEADAGRLEMRLQVDTGAPVAVPLPGHVQHWLPRTVLIDDDDGPPLLQGSDGSLWVRLEPGIHEVILEGPLPERDTVQLPLPLVPGWVEAQIADWTLEGLHGDGIAEPSLQLNRIVRSDGEAGVALAADQLPPFARVERTLRLGLTWQVDTRVVRLAPPDAALVLAVPLLPGESVTTADVRVSDDRAQINLPPQAGEMSWQSALAERSPIELRAAAGVPWVEVWRLDASPIWHVDAEGIPSVLPTGASVAPGREWRPWPGESVTLAVIRPEGVPGRTLTIDESELWLSPGLRATDAALALAVRSSRGAQHTLELPDGAELLGVTINGMAQPIRQEGRAVVLPVDPGLQRIELRWRAPTGMTVDLRSPPVDLGAPSVNAHLGITMPAGRWILFAGGPRFGPAVLFWSVLPVLALAAFGLGRVRSTPLRARHWFLLGIGLTQVPVVAAVAVAGWLLALGWRRERGAALGARPFVLLQLLLIVWTVAALGILLFAIQQGLLGQPEMQIAGNGSSAAALRWYQDRAAALLPQAWVVSTPLLVYRLLMLAWALWLAEALLRWLRWAWDSFAAGGTWRRLR